MEPQHSVAEAEAATDVEDAGFEQAKEVRPWVRYWARVLDIYLFALVAGFVLPLFSLDLLAVPGGDAGIGILILFLWMFAESFLLIMTGTTPGKWFLKVRLIPEDDLDFTYLDALKRSAKVWVMGTGMGVPIVSLVTLIISYNRLTKDGITAWDRDGGFTVEHGTIGWLRISILLLLVAAFIGLMILGAASAAA